MAVSSTPDFQNIIVEDSRTCWICFATDEEDEGNPVLKWVHPCGCKGSGKWVHESCLLLWVDEKKKESVHTALVCPQCKVEFTIICPKPDIIMTLIQRVDGIVVTVCPVASALVSVWMVYWSASSYGAFTIMQIFGEEEGLKWLEKMEPTILLMILPSIPTSLIVMKMIPWEHYVLDFLRCGSKLPILKHFLPSIVYNNVNGKKIPVEPERWEISLTRVFVGALVLPTIAKIFGDLFFHTEKSSLKKCFLGGLTFVTLKGVLKMYCNQKTYIQRSQRQVLNIK